MEVDPKKRGRSEEDSKVDSDTKKNKTAATEPEEVEWDVEETPTTFVPKLYGVKESTSVSLYYQIMGLLSSLFVESITELSSTITKTKSPTKSH